MEWRDIPDYEGIYQVSEYGDVRSLPRVIMRRNGRKKTIEGKILKPYTYDKYGHLSVALGKNGIKKHKTIHSLVMLAFAGSRPFPECDIRHLDGNSKNNYIGNLVYGTRSENMTDCSMQGKVHGQKLSKEEVIKIRELSKEGIPHRKIAKIFGIHSSSVMDIIKRRSYKWIEPFEEVDK